MILSEQIINGRRFRIIVQEWYGMEWGSANARDEAVQQMVRELIEQAEIVALRQQLDAAQAAVTLQRTRIERQRRVVDKVRQMLFKPNRDIEYGDINGLRAAIAELDAQPAPVAETAEGGK